MNAQNLFREKGYEVADNRSIEWRSINKALNYGISLILVDLGKCRTTKKGYNWKICLQYNNQGLFYEAYYKAKDLNLFKNGRWQSMPSDIVGGQALSCILDFRERLIEKGLFKVGIDFEGGETAQICKCVKCNGKGRIQAFMHISKGVCFDCMGLGYGREGIV